MKIVENGIAVCGIALPQAPTPREVFAAEELASYIKKISGAEVPFTDNCENVIVIGEPARNPLAEQLMTQDEFEAAVPGPEGFIIKTGRNMLLLAGSSKNMGEQERGTLYAVYELLELFLGCNFAAYCKEGIDAGEVVPKMKNIELNDICHAKPKADVGYRTAIVQYGAWVGNPEHTLNKKFIGWLAKNRYNRILTWAKIYDGYKQNGMLEEIEKRGIALSVGHHQAITMLLPHNGNEYFSENYSKTHPEYYKLMEDGSRYVVKDGDYDGQLILCMRNENLIYQMTENIIKWSDANPYPDIICLWPYDGKNEQCCCEKCKNFTKSENYSYFINRIAENVSKIRPRVKIDRISYLDLLECNDKKMSSSVIVNKAVWHSDLRRIGKPDGSCFKNSEYEINIMEWKKTGAQVVYYDYLMGIYANKQKWLPAADEIQEVCKRLIQLGIYGLGTQLETYNMWNHIFNFYTYGRTAYDTVLSFADNLDKFTEIFGEGAQYIKEIICIGEEIVDGQVPISETTEYLMNHIDKEKIYNLYENALSCTTDKLCRNNIRLMRMVWRYTDLEFNNPKLDEDGTKAYITLASDETGEIWYMSSNFDSFINSNEGYGISIPAIKRSDVEFKPNKWYLFE